MTCISKDDDWEAAESWDDSFPFDPANWAGVFNRVIFDEMVDDENDQIADRDECNDAGVFERVKALEK